MDGFDPIDLKKTLQYKVVIVYCIMDRTKNTDSFYIRLGISIVLPCIILMHRHFTHKIVAIYSI